ncbi:MAG: hypothetical protein FGM23_01445 [Alphaproteobacteria bacterium]|nr:hypothetical protein [Alphaproteobacteria bacterium]
MAEAFVVVALTYIIWTTQTLTNVSLNFSMASLAASAQTLQELQSEQKPPLQQPQSQPQIQPQPELQQPAAPATVSPPVMP